MTTRLRRDRPTIALYATMSAWGWLLYSFGPSVPLIQSELGTTRAQAGLVGTAMSLGTITVGLASPVLVRALGRRGSMYVGALVFAVGLGVLGVAHSLPLVLLGAYVVSLGGPVLVTSGQPALAALHREAGSAAITEANAVGAGVGLIAPVVVGLFVDLGLGWRPAVAISVLIAAGGVALLRTVPRIPALSGRATRHPVSTDRATSRRRFPLVFWFFLVALVMGGAIETSTSLWATDLLRVRTGAGDSIATTAIAALIGGMFVARLVLSPLSMRKAPEKLLLVSFAVAAVGWFVFWSASSIPLAMIGLAVAGIGYGGQYPLAITLLIRASDGRPDQAMGLAALFGGISGAIAPFALGAIADSVGIVSAFLCVPVLIVVGSAATACGLWRVHHPDHSGPRRARPERA